MPDESVLLVTGASSDLGCALLEARARAEPGARIVAHCHTGSARLEALRRDAVGLAGMEIVQADLGTREGADSLVAWLRAKDLLPHRIVHLPALRLRYQRPKGLDVKRFETDMSVQVQSLMVIAGACLPGMAARCANDSAMPNGKLVGVCSSVVLGVPPRYTVPYTTVKYAQLGLLKALAADYAGQRVNINIVSPSMIATQFLTELPAKAVEMAAARHPMGRNALPSDVIPTIEHLLSPASDFLTGVNIPITGGETG